MGNYVDEVKKGEVVYDIHDARVPSDMEPGRVITLADSQFIEDVLDNVKSTDLIYYVDYAYIIGYKDDTVVTLLNIADDSLYFERYVRRNNAWVYDASYTIANTDYVDNVKGTKLYKHIIDINNSDGSYQLMFITNSGVNIFTQSMPLTDRMNKLLDINQEALSLKVYNESAQDEPQYVLNLQIHTSPDFEIIAYVVNALGSIVDELSGITITSLTDTVTEL